MAAIQVVNAVSNTAWTTDKVEIATTVANVTFQVNAVQLTYSQANGVVANATMTTDVGNLYANAIVVFQKHQVQLISAFEKYDVILLAVAHDFFKALDYASLKTSPEAIVYDTKAFLDRSIVTARL